MAWTDVISGIEQKYGLPPGLLLGIVQTECPMSRPEFPACKNPNSTAFGPTQVTNVNECAQPGKNPFGVDTRINPQLQLECTAWYLSNRPGSWESRVLDWFLGPSHNPPPPPNMSPAGYINKVFSYVHGVPAGSSDSPNVGVGSVTSQTRRYLILGAAIILLTVALSKGIR